MTPEVTNISQLIRKDISITYDTGNNWTSSDIENALNFFKDVIYTELDGKTVGKSILVSSVEFFYVVACCRAAWELGCNIFNHQYSKGWEQIPGFDNFYHFLSLRLIRGNAQKISYAKFRNINEFDRNKNYPTKEYVLDRPITLDTIAVKTHTSGTTGMPKLIDYSHRMVINKVQESIKIYNWTDKDIPLHFHTLHHSSLFMGFAIPLLTICQQHYAAQDQYNAPDTKFINFTVFFNKVLPFAKKYNITQMLIPYGRINHLQEVDPIDFEQTLTWYNPGGAAKKDFMISLFQKFNVNAIVNKFGCSEIGELFSTVVTKHTLDDYELNKFDRVSGIIDYEIHDTYIKVRLKGNTEWIILSDMFKEHNGIFYYHGRYEQFVVNGIEVDINVLKKYLSESFGSEFTLILDYEINKLYLAIYDNKIPIDLDKVNEVIGIKFSAEYKLDKLQKFNLEEVRSGAKPSNPLLLYYFRTRV